MGHGFRALALLALLAGPMAANAVIIQVDYTGTVTSTYGSGLGYVIGDSISGSMFIDTELVERSLSYTFDTFETTNYSSADARLVIGGKLGVGDEFASASDWVQVDNKLGAGYYDQYRVFNDSYSIESGIVSDLHESVQVGDYLLDFISGTSLVQTFSLTSADLIDGYMNGLISQRQFSQAGGGDRYYDTVNYDLFSINARVVSAPEPSTLALFGLGLAGLGFARRRKLN